MSQAEIEEKPGVALYNAQKATRDLVREIKILSRNIHRYPERALKEAATPKERAEFIIPHVESCFIVAKDPQTGRAFVADFHQELENAIDHRLSEPAVESAPQPA